MGVSNSEFQASPPKGMSRASTCCWKTCGAERWQRVPKPFPYMTQGWNAEGRSSSLCEFCPVPFGATPPRPGSATAPSAPAAVEDVPEGEFEIPLGRARTVQQGSDITLVGWGQQVKVLELAVSCQLAAARSHPRRLHKLRGAARLRRLPRGLAGCRSSAGQRQAGPPRPAAAAC